MSVINEKTIFQLLDKKSPTRDSEVEEILSKALEGKGLDASEIAILLRIKNQDQKERLYQAARLVKKEIYGNRIVLFAPLYLSNYCTNNCCYCGFSVTNRELKRKFLSMDEAVEEAKILVAQGQKRLLLVCGEDDRISNPAYVAGIMEQIYKKTDIRRLNVNIAPLTLEGFQLLKKADIGTYQLFQETYHKHTYEKMHRAGAKKDYHWRISAYDRAFQAGIDDLGFGVLFGLYDYKFEILALHQHIRYFESAYGVGPHTISVPRWRPAQGAMMKEAPYPVDDETFLSLVAILRLAVPYTGIILSTREPAELRNRLFHLGVSQISAGSSTSPGGYKEEKQEPGQFDIDDTRSLDEIVAGICRAGYLPSFCTACYRNNRTGHEFMAMAKAGAIKNMCQVNAIITFWEYLLDYASPECLRLGKELLAKEIEKINSIEMKRQLLERLKKLDSGVRDLFF